MNGFTVRQRNDAQDATTELGNGSPEADAPIGLDLASERPGQHSFAPLALEIRALP